MSGNIALLTGTLARAKRENRAALIGGMPAGFPTVDGGIAAIATVLNSGADVVEVGLPHTDPVLDGPVIQTADDIALRGGVRIHDVIRTAGEAYRATGFRPPPGGCRGHSGDCGCPGPFRPGSPWPATSSWPRRPAGTWRRSGPGLPAETGAFPGGGGRGSARCTGGRV